MTLQMPILAWTSQAQISTDPSLIVPDAFSQLFDSSDFHHWDPAFPLKEQQRLVQRLLYFDFYEVNYVADTDADLDRDTTTPSSSGALQRQQPVLRASPHQQLE